MAQNKLCHLTPALRECLQNINDTELLRPCLTSLSIGGNSLTVSHQQEFLIMKYTIGCDDIPS